MHASVALMDIGFGFDLEDPAPDGVRMWSGEEFDRLVEHGFFEDEHVELLHGWLVTMSPQGEPHSRITGWLQHVFARALDLTYDIRGHSTFAVARDSRPEPDLSVAMRDRALVGYPRRALLLIEVSESSLRKDREIKLPLYAKAGVPEYWIVDLKASAVEVHTEPTPKGYRRVTVCRAGDVLRPLQLPAVAIPVSEIPFEPRGPDR